MTLFTHLALASLALAIGYIIGEVITEHTLTSVICNVGI